MKIAKITNRFPTGPLFCNFRRATTAIPGTASTSSILLGNVSCPRYWLPPTTTTTKQQQQQQQQHQQRYLHCMTLPLVHDNKTLVLQFRSRSTHSLFRKSNCCCWKRHQSSDESFRRGNTNPYAVLGVSSSSTLEEVQKAFVKLALEHHPDTSLSSSEPSTNDTNNNNNNNDNHTNFIRIRQAFEAIRTAHGKRNGDWKDTIDDDDIDDGMTDDTMDNLIHWTEQDFLDWFYEASGTRLSSEERRELVSMYRNALRGGQHYHGFWELARRLVAEQDAFFRAQQMELEQTNGRARRRHQQQQQQKRTPFQNFQQQQRQHYRQQRRRQQQQQEGNNKQSTTTSCPSATSTSNLRRKRIR